MSSEPKVLNFKNVESREQSGMEKVVSKILVCDDNEDVLSIIRDFCNDNRLIGYKVQPDNIMDVLDSNIDLGGIFVSEDFIEQTDPKLLLLNEIHKKRKELPIFLRTNNDIEWEEYVNTGSKIFVGCYNINEISKLTELVDKYLFNIYYPEELVVGIRELSLDAFSAAFKNVEVTTDVPYIVKDKIIYGQLFSLIALESSWCRGYMMLQTEQETIMDVIASGKTQLDCEDPNFRDVNAMLSEVSNLIWGSFKGRFIKQDKIENLQHRIQVPIIVNHARKYICFGSDDPQLCFKYRLNFKDSQLAPVTLYQKFVFSLAWSPDKFKESQQKVDSLVQGGELELF
jgi:hypothetical protein